MTALYTTFVVLCQTEKKNVASKNNTSAACIQGALLEVATHEIRGGGGAGIFQPAG